MTEEDSGEYRRRLAEMLERRGFSWVVEQPEAQIADGKQNAKQVAEVDNPEIADLEFGSRPARRRRSSLVTSVAYSEGERLEILLHAVHSALVERSTIESTLFESLTDIGDVEFLPDPTTDPDARYRDQGHRLSRSDEGSRYALRRKAEAALRNVREAK